MIQTQTSPTRLFPPPRPRPPMGLGGALVGREEEALLLEVVRSRQLFRYTYTLPPEAQGRMTATLEKEICQMMNVRYALAVTSGTAALETALGAMGIGPGDEVIIPAWSWISCFTAVVRVGALPVLAELDTSFCLAPGEIKRLATPQTKAVLVMHYQGVAAEMEALLAEAKTLGIRVLEDCAQSPGASYHGRPVGSMGDMGIYSFQINKCITSGEGGMVVTNDPLLYERAVRMHDIGNYRPHHTTIQEPQSTSFAGSQFRMNEVTGAVALAQLHRLPAIREHCRRLSRRVLERIAHLPQLEFRHLPDPNGDLGFEIYFCLPTPVLAKTFEAGLNARNVNCSRTTGTYCHYVREYCLRRAAHSPAASPFRHFSQWPAPGYRAEDFPKTEALIHRFVSLPIGVLYTEEDADYIADCVLDLHQALGLDE